MYKSIYAHYTERIQQTKADLSAIKKKIYSLGTIRLLVFFGTIAAAYLFRGLGTTTIFITIVTGLILFLIFLVQYNKAQKKKQYLETSIQCDKNEIKGLDYDFSAFDGAPERIDSGHFYSLDLDIFGNQSLFQSINRTCTNYGKKVLINWFEKPLNQSSEIEKRQEAIKELSQKADFIHHFQVLGLINPGKDSDYAEIEKFAKSQDYISSRKLWKTLNIIVPSIWILCILLVSISILPSDRKSTRLNSSH